MGTSRWDDAADASLQLGSSLTALAFKKIPTRRAPPSAAAESLDRFRQVVIHLQDSGGSTNEHGVLSFIYFPPDLPLPYAAWFTVPTRHGNALLRDDARTDILAVSNMYNRRPVIFIPPPGLAAHQLPAFRPPFPAPRPAAATASTSPSRTRLRLTHVNYLAVATSTATSTCCVIASAIISWPSRSAPQNPERPSRRCTLHMASAWCWCRILWPSLDWPTATWPWSRAPCMIAKPILGLARTGTFLPVSWSSLWTSPLTLAGPMPCGPSSRARTF
jgi:hypothetical protein